MAECIGAARIRGGAAVLLALALAGCDRYPDGWPKIEAGWSGCPEIAGTYRVDAPAGGNGAPLEASLFSDHLPLGEGGPSWDTLTLAGNPEKRLEVTLSRTPATVAEWISLHAPDQLAKGQDIPQLYDPAVRWSRDNRSSSDEDYVKGLDRAYPALSAHAVLLAGTHYLCDGGWLSGRRMVPDDTGTRVLDGQIRFVKDASGGLVAHSTHNSILKGGKVCKFGICIPVPFGRDTNDEWERWNPAKPDVTPLPWLASFQRDPKPSYWNDVQDSAQRLDEVKGALGNFEVKGLTVEEVKADGPGSVRATLSAKETLPFNLLFRSLDHSNRFREVEVTGLSGDAAQGYRMEVAMGLMPRASDTSRTIISQRIQSLLPDYAEINSIEPFLDGFRVTIHTTDERVMRLAERNIKESDQFERVQVETHYYDGDSRDLVLKVWEKARTPYWPGSASPGR